MYAIGNLIVPLPAIPAKIAQLEQTGYRCAFTSELNNDPFLPLLLAAEHSHDIKLLTGIAVAFARSPMTMAQTAYDLQGYSRGRLMLGMGSQIKAHIERRYHMPWSKPAARMREYVLAMRAIWRCWLEDEPLKFEGEFYRHTLMTPMFTPANHGYGPPKVMLGGVGPLMTEVAGEVGDGFVAHGFTTADYFRQVTLAALERGLAKSGRTRRNIEIICPLMVVAGVDEEAYKLSEQAARKQIAFYASTPQYKPVLDHHGWGDLHAVMHSLSRAGKWDEMAQQLPNEVLRACAVVCEDPMMIPAELNQRYGDMIDGWMCTFEHPDTAQQTALLHALQHA